MYDVARFLAKAVLVLVPLLLSLSVHEYAHAWIADRLGDDTPRLMGRLTLNPLAHIDPVGSLLVPLVGVWAGFYFGWAKPVAVHPTRITRKLTMAQGLVLISAAGPISNLLLALVTVLLHSLLLAALGAALPPSVRVFLLRLFQINLILAVFNLLPIPPLDGSRILFGLLPRRFEGLANTLRFLSPILFIALLLKAGIYLHKAVLLLEGAMDWATWGQVAPLLEAAGLG